jgi:hypothetical protein
MDTTEDTLIPPSGRIAERLAEVETEARALRRLLKLATDREQERRRRDEFRHRADPWSHPMR